MENPIDKHGQPYGLTEESTEVYRLHSLLPEALHLKAIGEDLKTETIGLPSTRQASLVKLTNRHSIGYLLYSFGTQHPVQLVLNKFPKFIQELSIPGNPLFDTGAVDFLLGSDPIKQAVEVFGAGLIFDRPCATSSDDQ